MAFRVLCSMGSRMLTQSVTRSSPRVFSRFHMHYASKKVDDVISVPRGGGHSDSPHSGVGVGKRGNMKSTVIIKRMARYLWPKGNLGVKQRVVTSVTLLAGAKLVTIAVPFFFKEIVDQMGSLVEMQDTASFLWTSPPGALLSWGVGGYILAYSSARFASSLFGELRNAVFSKVAQGAIRSVGRDTFAHLLQLDMGFHLNRQVGALSRAIDRGSRGIDFVLRAVLFHFAPTLLEISMVVGILGHQYGAKYASVAVGAVVSYTAFTLITTEWRTKFRQEMNSWDALGAGTTMDALLNVEVVKYFVAEANEVKAYDRCLAGYEKAAVKTQQSLAFLNYGQNFVFSTALGGMMMMAAWDMLHGGSFTVGDLVMINGLLLQLSLPLNFLGSVWRDMSQSLVDMEFLWNLVDTKPKLLPDPDATDLVYDPSKGGLSLEFKDVHFSYGDERSDMILKGVSFQVDPGKELAIVGTSGGGKSTIMRLLLHFYKVNRGQILIEGQELNKLTDKSIRGVIGIIPQDTALFNNTIAYNIAYGKPEATLEEVQWAAKVADIAEKIESMPQKYETVVGERGMKLSGGEKQRVAIARAVLSNPPILLCDEATSSLDSHTESSILQTLRKIGNHRTVITIAHRLSTVVNADKIIVLDKGVVVESGTHEDLVHREEGVYRQMWRAQLDKTKNE